VKLVVLTAAAALVAGCDRTAAPPPAAAALPDSVCKDAQAAVQAVTANGAVLLTSSVEASLAHESWLAMPEEQRASLTRAMGLAATCSSGLPKLEQEVTIRSETGQVLTRRTVETSLSITG
jgi:hypothetical protein